MKRDNLQQLLSKTRQECTQLSSILNSKNNKKNIQAYKLIIKNLTDLQFLFSGMAIFFKAITTMVNIVDFVISYNIQVILILVILRTELKQVMVLSIGLLINNHTQVSGMEDYRTAQEYIQVKINMRVVFLMD